MANISADGCIHCGTPYEKLDLSRATRDGLNRIQCGDCLKKIADAKSATNVIRRFDSGATRDTIKGKLSYVKALSSAVLQRYVQYLDAHRKQSDGSMRDFDNWKKGIPEETYLDGLGRHFMAVWLLTDGFSASDNHGPVTLEDSLCAIIFGASGWLHELLKKDLEKKFICPVGWRIQYLSSKHCGWFICKNDNIGLFLHKDLQLHSGTSYCGLGKTTCYWPTKEAAEDALRRYLEKKSCGKTG